MTLYSPKDVAGIIGVSTPTLFHWRGRNVGPDHVRRGALVYYPAGDLRRYIERVGPIPAGMTNREKQSFFMKAHRPEREPAPEREPVPEPEPATIAELAARLAAVERVLVKIKTGTPKRRKRRTAANTLRRKVRRRAAPVIPY